MTNHNHRHERYEEMCAVAAIGELPEVECREFQTHLLLCEQCQQSFQEFCRISADYLSGFATQSTAKFGKSEDDLDVDHLLTECLSRAAEQGKQRVPKSAPAKGSLGRLSLLVQSRPARVASYSLAAILLIIAAGITGFQISQRRLPPSTSTLREPLILAPQRSGAARVGGGEPGGSLETAQKLKDLSARYSFLLHQKRDLEEQLSSAQDRLQALQDKFQAYELQSQLENATATAMQARLADLEYQLISERQSVAALKEQLRLKDEQETQLAAKEPPPVPGDDAKTLFGARDLHIVDVYDVDGRGKTRKTFGRVYYVEKKFLLFYAFDLQDRTHSRSATAFQAWGYKEASSASPQNLGVFNVDDASINRWVLKVNNPKVLEHVDVVFVTSERSPGSPTPNGRRLLYASLAGVPNHP